MELKDRVRRDKTNGEGAASAAKKRLQQTVRFTPQSDMARGTSKHQIALAENIGREAVSLRAIADRPFDAMVEAEVTTDVTRKVLWYAHRDSDVAQALPTDGGDVQILPWTHPGLQIALSQSLGKAEDLKRTGYTLKRVRPVARARFQQVLPAVAGLYEPGGRVDGVGESATAPAAGLKAVKLEMTPEQVRAFVSRMNGVLIVTGAPGTGKTTIAFQRIRFLFDQQALREAGQNLAPYEPALTRVFLANRNLIDYSTALLRDQLGIPRDVVSYVPDFVRDYVEAVWQPRFDARPRRSKVDVQIERAREAMLNLCRPSDLLGVWHALERQAHDRLGSAPSAEWLDGLDSRSGLLGREFAKALAAVPRRQGVTDPLDSAVRLDRMWTATRKPYMELRASLPDRARSAFDGRFARWISWVYDPLDALRAYFSKHQQECRARIRSGTLGGVDAGDVVKDLLDAWEDRQYGPTELSWIAWIMRFVLQEEAAPEDGFRELQRAIPLPEHRSQRRWTHLVIDEAQDLSVQEASLLTSFVHPRGALTVSADFQQVVSPVHGMMDGEALKVGLPIWDRSLYTQFPFRTNLRQSNEIGRFLAGFYAKAFQQFPPFEAGARRDRLPVLYTGPQSRFPQLVRQMMNAIADNKDLRRIALLQVHDDPLAMDRLRAALGRLGVPLGAPYDLSAERVLLTSSVERAKGLEFEVCLIIGLDDVEHASLNFAKNRAYVALSRPTHRLFMLCENYPTLLRGLQKDLFEHRTL